jgi:hypothetical protein
MGSQASRGSASRVMLPTSSRQSLTLATAFLMGLASGLAAIARSGDRPGVLGECIRDGGVDTVGRGVGGADCTSLIASLLDDMALVGRARSGFCC